MKSKSSEYNHGTVVELKATPQQGWRFTGWKGDLSGSENPKQITVDKAKSVTAVFEPPFALTKNGVTVVCSNAEVGESGTAGGVTYTKRTKYQITPEMPSRRAPAALRTVHRPKF